MTTFHPRAGRGTVGRRLAVAAAAALAVGTLTTACLAGSAETPAAASVTWSSPTPIYAASSIQAQGYAYAPSAIAGSPERYYTCHSRASGTVRDDIFLTTRSGGGVTSSVSVMTSSASGAWDDFHICDPSVVRVDVEYAGAAYDYAMFYLGNDEDCSCHNQVGVAFAASLSGPWVKHPSPVIAFTGSSTTEWGAGQPSATTIDAASGTVALTWTQGYSTGTGGVMAQVDFSTGTPVVTASHAVPTAGLEDADGNPDWLNNFDIVYSPQRDRFFLVRELHPYPSSSPNYISAAVQVASIAGGDLWAGTGSWTVEGVIDQSVTGAARTHNPGFLRTVYGTLPDEESITVVYTSASLDPGALWTYALHSTTGVL